MIKPFLYAMQFLTRIPVPLTEPPSPTMQGRAVLAYPLVGLVIGALLVALHFALAAHLSTSLQAALLLVVWVGITGALHIDGVADMADAWVGGCGDRERTLRIMKDPTCGPMAVTTVVLLLLVKYTTLEALLTLGAWQALWLAPILGRAALIAALLTLPYVRREGLGSEAADRLSKPWGWGVLALTLLLSSMLIGSTILPLIAILALLFWLFSQNVMQRIGGITGDVAGAVCEGVELCSLLLILLLIS